MDKIYKLELHESTVIETKQTTEGNTVKWIVTRVPGGWIYQRSNVNVTDQTTTFVPFNNEFMQRTQIPTHETTTPRI